MKTAKFSFVILEQNGSVDVEERDYEIVAGLQAAARFVSLFERDPYKRVARVSINGKPAFTYDSELDSFYAGRLESRKL